MALTIDWPTKVINVPKDDLLLVQSSPTEIRQLDLDSFRLELKQIEGSEEGSPFLDTHTHNTTVTVGGVTLARVIEIINGYSVTFEDGQYAVNLVGANSNVGDVVNVNQVSVRSANSAGLTFSEEINKQSFLNGYVYISPTHGLSGIQFPRGTTSDPVDNLDDALIIADNNGLIGFNLEGVLSIGASQDISDKIWAGNSVLHSDLTLGGGDVSGCAFSSLLLKGQSNGVISAKECLISNLSDFQGILKECQLVGNILVDSSSTSKVSLLFCASGVAGEGTPILDFNSANTEGELRFYAGGIEIRNFNQGNNLSIDMVSGHVKIDASCTSGTILIRGSCKVTDESNGATVNVDDAFHVTLDNVKKNAALIPATL